MEWVGLFVVACRKVQQQIHAEIEKEQSQLKLKQTETIEKLRQDLDQRFVDEQSRLRCACELCVSSDEDAVVSFAVEMVKL